MQETTKDLCENIQGCVLGYLQSDEITLVLVDYKKLTSSSWFDYEVQKVCSVTASMATDSFKRYLIKNIYEAYKDKISDSSFLQCIVCGNVVEVATIDSLAATYLKALYKGAKFDARCFNIPKEEVTNCIYWRQLDAIRNSIQMVGQAYFPDRKLQNKSCDKIQDMLIAQKDINWNDLPTYQKRGSCVVKEEYYTYVDEHGIMEELDPDEDNVNLQGVSKRSRWTIDKDIPIFKGKDREYIDKLVYVGE